MVFYQLEKEQMISTSIDEVWDFISSPINLKEITPDYMGFDITSKNLPAKMYPGLIISYIVKPLLGIPMLWVTEITQVVDKKFFIDQQRIGPYSFWHHQHIIEPISENKVLMKDIVSYKLPFSFLGVIVHALFIRNQLEDIFDYRNKVLAKKFPAIL